MITSSRSSQTRSASAPPRRGLWRRPPLPRFGRIGTRRTLLLLQSGLLLATVVALSTSLWTLREMARGVNGVHAQTAPAVLELSDARRALAAADRAAITAFNTEGSQLIGFRPGEEYQEQIGLANQSMAQAAEDTSVGADGSRELQLAEGLLVVYTGWIGQAGAHFQQGNTVLGTADLWNASRLMHDRGGILDRLGALQKMEQDRLAAEASTHWWRPSALLVWAGPVTVLLVLLVAAQWYLTRRFRRLLNLPLALATVILLGCATAVVLHAAGSRGELAEARRSLERTLHSRDADMARSDAQRRHALAVLLKRECADGCGPTVDDFIARYQNAPADPAPLSSTQTLADRDEILTAVRDARLGALAAPGVGGAALVVFVLVGWGFWARINEYRFQSR